MKNFFKSIILFILFPLLGLEGFGSGAYAQLFPVQLTPVFKSPYSVKISDYATSMDTKFQLLINPTDVTISQRQVRLKLYIQGNGVNIRSSDYITGQRPIFINGGEFQTLTNSDISALFRLENLQGITASQYANPLPDGIYDFCFEMYDYITNQKISQKSCASIYLILNDPPLLNTPQKNEQIAASDFSNIMFTWTPRQMNATNVSYKFELKQIIDPTLDPQFAFQMAPLLYEETVFSTAMLYNLSMPILTPGMRYAWRVRAISTTGLSENAIFKNDGYSEIYSFKYTASCASPTFLLSEAQGPTSVKITWQGIPEHTKYQLQYKKQDVRNAQWFSTNSLNTQSLITNLEPGVTYQFRVGSSCDPATEGVQSFTYSGISTFTTPTQTNGVPAYNCGIIPKINIQNQKVLTNLIQSETFTAGDFPVTVLELQGENSPYSGKGYIIVPYLADTKIAVEFNNITINTDYQLISGVVETSYNPDWKNITNLEDFTGEGQSGKIKEEISFEIDKIVINANGDIVVNGKNGEQVTIPGGKDTVITDNSGKTYYVDKDGNGSNEGIAQAQGGKPTPENTDGVDKNGQVTAFTAQGISIVFSNNEDANDGAVSKYAFDVMPNNKSAALEKLYKKVGNVALPYKAVVNGNSDTVLATVSHTYTNIKLDSIVFKTESGGKIDFVRNDKTFTLTVKGKLTYAEEQILATIKQGDKSKVIGAFMLVHISPKEVNVALVPTDKTSQDKLDAIISNTQAIYNKVGVKINFKKEGILKDFDKVVPDNVDQIQTEKNTLTSTYSTVQQNINDLYKGDGNSYVLFITHKESNTGQEGYMRLNGQFGYVFTPPSGVGGTKTPAHELGHGIFKLQHPFEQYQATERSTDFLMDYSSGTVLNHQDWKQINDPAFKLYAFQSQASGENREANELDLLGNIFKVTENEDVSGNILVGKVSQNTPYLITGFNVYKKDTKKKLATFDGQIVENEVIYKLSYKDADYNRVTNLGDKMPYPVTLSTSGKAVIKISNDSCTYSYKNILNWTKPKNATTNIVIEEIKKLLVKDNTFITEPLYAPDPTCSVINSIADLITNDNNKCQPNIVAADKKKLKDLFDKKTFTNAELVKLIVTEHVCIAALREAGWDNLKKAFTQLSLSTEIKNDQEIAILRVMVAIDSKNLNNFYDLISLNNHEIIVNLNKHLNDHSINPYDTKNYTSFYQGLMAMFSVNNTNIEALIPADKTESYKFIKNLVPEAVTGFDESYYYEYITNQTVSDKFRMIPVFWRSISYSKRMDLIKDAMGNNSGFDKSEEILLNLFIHEKAVQTITAELDNNSYKLLWDIYGVLDGKERKYFVQDVLYKTLQYKKIGNNYANNLALEIRNKYNTIQPLKGIRTEPYFMFYDKGIFNVVSNDGAVLEYNLLVTKAMADNSKIQFNCSYQVINSKNQHDPVQHLFTLYPYEYVVLEIPKDFKVDGRDFKKGLFAVPAIYAYWLVNAVEDHNSAILFRLVADGVAIALAPFTSGGSLLALELGMVSTDILITVTNYNNPDAISPKYNAYWDAIYAIYNLPKAVAGLTNLTTGVFQFVVKESGHIQAVRIIRGNIKNFVAEFKGLNETERLAHLNAIDNLLETLSTGIKGGTLSPDEVRVSKKMYDMIFEARIKCQNIDKNLSSIIDITVDNSGLFLNNGITASQKIANVSISQNVVKLSDISWQPAGVTNVKLINIFDKISYVDKAGQTVNGAIQLVEDLNNKGTFYVTPKLLGPATLASRLESLSLLALKNEVNGLGVLKPKFLEDFANTDENVLKILQDEKLVDVWKNWEGKGIKDIDDLKAFQKVYKQTVRNVSFTDFYTKTTTQISKANGNKFAPDLYEAWSKGKGNESGLKTVYKKYGLDPAKEYPPCEGVWGLIEIRGPRTGELYDRFQTREGLGGGYAGVVLANSSYTVSSRALMENYSELVEQGKDYYYYKFKFKTVPSGLVFEYGEAIPWFDELGGAIQVKTSSPFQNLSTEIEIVETWKMKDGVWSKVQHLNWIQVDDIRSKINVKIGHVIENLDLNSVGTKFTGCHSKISLQNFTTSNPTTRYEFRDIIYDINSGVDNASRVFEAKPVVIKSDGTEIIKGNNQGVSSFFPQNWDKNKILDEVEYAIANNLGRDLTSTNPNEYYGFSKDGKVEIHFYYNADGSIGSFFPKKR